jgi:hypothetical protein
MKTEILSPLITEDILGTYGRIQRIAQPYGFRSVTLYNQGLDPERWIETDFYFDKESVPLFKGSCPWAGAVHDPACRKDFDESGKVGKIVAADMYLEFMKYCYDNPQFAYGRIDSGIKGDIRKILDIGLEYGKYSMVVCWPGYFHKLNMHSTLEEVRAAL